MITYQAYSQRAKPVSPKSCPKSISHYLQTCNCKFTLCKLAAKVFGYSIHSASRSLVFPVPGRLAADDSSHARPRMCRIVTVRSASPSRPSLPLLVSRLSASRCRRLGLGFLATETRKSASVAHAFWPPIYDLIFPCYGRLDCQRD